MFLEQYRLETNPFAPNQVRPRFESRASHQGLARLQDLVEGRIHCLFLSGPAGVGKSTLVGRCLTGAKGAAVSWIRPDTDQRLAFLQRLLGDLGPAVIEGSVRELRNIAEVYLRHQSGQGRSSIIVADGLERLSVPVLRELERLAGLRFRNRPIVHMVLLTRNEDLVSDLTPEDGGGQLARYLHQRLTGFDLEETRGYLRACLQSVGCHWEEELIPPEVIIDIQAFTHGIVADIDALCFEALNLLSREDHGAQQRPRLTRALVRQAGGGLHMKYDPRAWQSVDEALSPDSVQESDPGELEIHTARLLVSSGGKVVAEVRLNRPRMVLGRDQGCDISLNSSYVSRYQNLFMETPDGWVIIDLNSTNGCFVNGRRVQEHKLRDGDTIAVGHHQLSFVRGRGGAERGQNVELISVGHADSAPADADTRVGRGIR